MGEENHLNAIGRKYVTIDKMKLLMRRAWDVTLAEEMESLLSFMVNHQPYLLQRVRTLKCLLWALPENAQQIGAMVYRK